MIKLILFIGLLLQSICAFSEDSYSVRLDGDKTISCHKPETGFILFCEDEGKILLVSYAGAVGNINDQQKLEKVNLLDVLGPDGKSVKDMFLPYDSPAAPDVMSEKMLLSSVFMALGNIPPGQKDFSSFQMTFYELYQKQMKKVNESLSSDIIEVSDGEATQECKRLQDNPDREKLKDFDSQLGVQLKCGVLKCSDGKVLFSTNIPDLQPELVSLDKDGNWDTKSITKFKAKGASRPYIDISRYADVSSMDTTNPYASALSSYGSYAPVMPQITPQHYIPGQFRNGALKLFLSQASFGETQYDSMAELCDPKDVQFVKDSLSAFRKKISSVPMAHYVTRMNDVLIGHLINPDMIPPNACKEEETYLNPEAVSHSQKMKPKDMPKVISEKEARKLFEKAKAMKDIAWGYKMDGCYARAHLMARRFEEMGHTVDKVWIKGDLEVKNGEETINWNFHVAPVVYVEDGKGGYSPWVIDPSIMDKPAPAENWAELMTKKVPGGVVKTRYPFPQNVSMYKRAALAFSSSDPYLPNDSIGMSEEQKMKLAKATMKEYKGYER